MKELLIALAIISCTVIVFIALSWGFSPGLSILKEQHDQRLNALANRSNMLSRINLALEVFAFSLVKSRGIILATSGTLLLASIVILSSAY